MPTKEQSAKADLRPVRFYLPAEKKMRLKAIAAEMDITQKQLGENVLIDFIDSHKVSIKPKQSKQ